MQIFIIMGLLVRILTVFPAMAGLGVTVALIPATTWLARKTAAIRKVCRWHSCPQSLSRILTYVRL